MSPTAEMNMLGTSLCDDLCSAYPNAKKPAVEYSNLNFNLSL
jgi:hypothetical protein